MKLMKPSPGMAGNQSKNMKNDEWLTPPEFFHVLGEFDLDPCSPISRPWPTAKHHYTILDNGLIQPWFGRVWMNPPYGTTIEQWMKKLSEHMDGIALTFARTDTNFFHKYVFNGADSILFIQQRLSFYNTAGIKAKFNGGAPSVLIAYGEQNVDALDRSGIKGKHLLINPPSVIIVGISPSWKAVVNIAVKRLNGEALLKEVYDMVELVAPDKVQKNKFFKEKIRQVLQQSFQRVGKGKYVIEETSELN